MPDEIRLQVYLAKCGIASRRKCEEIISQGRITVNGKVVITPGTKVSEEDIITYDGRKIRQTKKNIYIALHKPSKYLCSTTDPDDRLLAINLLTPVINYRLFNVGRLDYLTSGLIFFTNDGDFAKKMTHPSTHIEKEYVVTTKDEIPVELMEEFKNGIYVQGERFKMKDFEFKGSRCVHIILEEGKNRELRKVFLSRNVSVKKVHRIRIGCIELKGINSGHFRKLTEREVKSLLKDADSKDEQNRTRKKGVNHGKTIEKLNKSFENKLLENSSEVISKNNFIKKTDSKYKKNSDKGSFTKDFGKRENNNSGRNKFKSDGRNNFEKSSYKKNDEKKNFSSSEGNKYKSDRKNFKYDDKKSYKNDGKKNFSNSEDSKYKSDRKNFKYDDKKSYKNDEKTSYKKNNNTNKFNTYKSKTRNKN